MTRKSKARYGMNRTYKINPAVKALRNALFAGMAMAAVAPAAQAACTVVGNTITCSGAFGATLNFGPGDVALPFDPTVVILDNTTVINLLDGNGVNAFSFMDLSITSDASIVAYSSVLGLDLAGIYALSQYGDASVTNNGAIDVRSRNGNAYGVVSASAYGDASAANNGGIVAASFAYDAHGMLVAAQYGDVSAANSGDIIAYSHDGTAYGMSAVAPFGDVTVSNGQYGTVYARSVLGDATGISAQSFTGDVSVDNDGAITALAYGDATGVNAFSRYGEVSVANSGDIVVGSTYGSAYGIYALSFYDVVAVENSGDITVQAYSQATGIYAISVYDEITVDNSGTITVDSSDGLALGIKALGLYGDVSINNDGDITVEAIASNAIGIAVYAGVSGASGTDVYVTGSGDISAATPYGNAIGINVFNGNDYGSVTIDVSGDISVEAYAYGNAIGINAYSYAGDVNITSAGTIDASNTYGNAIGIKTGRFGYSVIDNSGNISAYTYAGNAIGIQADSFYGSYITNSGDINAETTYGSARGIQALTTFDVTVVNSGDITASSYAVGSAQGIRAKSSNGYASVTNSGDISATSTYTNAISILATGQYGVEIYNTGDLSANSDANVYGIYAQSRFGDAYVYNAGDISANATNLPGQGIYAKAGYDAVIVNSGDISASSDYAVAYGAYAYGQFGVAAIFNSGDVNTSAYYDATGLFAKSLYDVAYINNSGDVSVSSAYGVAAYGLYASAFQSTAVILNYGGDVSADGGYDADASALVAVALDDVVIYNSGDLNAYAYNGDAIGIVGATTNGNVSIYNIGGDISAESVNGNAYGIYARSTYAGDILVANTGAMDISGGVTAFGVFAVTNDGDISVANYGEMSVSSNLDSGGIRAVTSGDVEVLNAGNMTIDSTYGRALAIFAQSNYGDIYVANSGDINASAYGPAVGIETRAKYDIEVFNLGDITVTSDESFAGGIFSSTTFGDVYVASQGDIDASSGNYAAGISAFTSLGNATALNTGDISVDAPGFSVGMQASAKYDVFVASSGSISSASVTGSSTGISAASAFGDVTVYNFGAMDISSVYGEATGIDANSSYSSYYYGSGDVFVANAGDMVVYSEYDQAVGISAEANYGSVYVSNSGDLNVSSGVYGNAAAGIFAIGKYDAIVANSGDLTVSSTNYAAVGIYARSAYAVEVGNSGDIDVTSYYGIAQGIFAYGSLGDTLVGNSGDITASSVYDVAEGITALSFLGDVGVMNSGDLMVSSEYSDATGINALVGGKYSDVIVYNAGAISAWADDSATGILAAAEAGDIGIYNNGAITANGYYATGISASTGSYTTYYGEYAYTTSGNISVVTGTASNIQANGYSDTYGMNLEADGYVSVSNAGSIKATASGYGAFSVGIRTESGYGTSISNSGTIDAAGDNAWAIVTYAEGTTITNTSTGKIFGAIWTTAWSNTEDSLTNDGKWYAGDINGTYFGGGDDSIVNNATGKIFMDDSYISMGYSEGSTNSFLNNGKLYANNDNYIDMGGNGSVFTNNGSSIHMDDADVNDTLTIYGDFAGTGHIVVNADGATMLADRLYIEGDVVTNTANIIDVKLLSGPSIADMLAGETIEIVHVSGTSTAANFNIGIVTPPFDELYTVESSLIKDINYSGTNDLFSLGFEISGLSTAGVVASSVAPGVQNLWNQGTGTLFQREGTHREFNQNPDGSGKAEYKAAAGVWVRGFTSSGSASPDAHRDNFGDGGSHGFDMDGSGIEFGVGYAFNSQWTAGLLGGTSESTVDPDAGGRADIDADTLGAYVTYTPGNGFYADFSYRAMDFDGYGMGGQSEFGFEGSADGYSLEMGYGYKMSSGLIIEPQFQYSSVDVDLNTIGYNMSDFELTDGDSSLLRIGAALRKSYKTAGGNYWTPYGALSWLNETDGSNSYEIGGLLTGDVDTGGGSALLEAGVTGFIGKFGVSAGMNWRDGSAYDSVFGGQLSVRYDW